ncbi:gastrula zinc finger protein XlCGF8.2DB [Bradysia coprophila]|uniref:gastrula zinc finger protein XlCGF8.2DB n=1 Tax=Bradysia coprophila TaxID=38358 RepID=UPI00187DCB7F|nr:gastrula zinc finger protein XlCGF8.2DB [Bradysia coprophila]
MIGLKRSILQRVEFCNANNNNENSDTIKCLVTDQAPVTNKKVTDFSIRKILSDEPSAVRISNSPQLFANGQYPIFNPINYVSESSADNCSEFAKCLMCDKMIRVETLKIHLRTHNTRRYECTECGKGFSQLRNYKYHVSVHRGSKEFAAHCPECNKVFNDKGYLSSHLKIHRNLKEYGCPHCSKSFNQRVAFNMHVRIHTGVKPHKCQECGKRFSRKMLLKQHLRTHSGEKPYQCSVCGKHFADRSNMTLHHRLHSGVKPFSCPICPKAFTKKHHLKTHLNYHCGYKPYKCPHPNCEQSFTQSSNMRTHSKKCQFRPNLFEPINDCSNVNQC